MRTIPSVLAALAATIGAPVTSAEPARPIGLRIDHVADMLDITVVTEGDQPANAQFELEVASEGAGGTTRTTQSGTSRGRPAGATLLTSRIGTSGLAGWRARLHVTVDGHEYVVLKSS